MTTATATKLYIVEATTRLSVFRWEMEDDKLANVLERITNRLRGIDVIEVKIGEAIE